MEWRERYLSREMKIGSSSSLPIHPFPPPPPSHTPHTQLNSLNSRVTLSLARSKRGKNQWRSSHSSPLDTWRKSSRTPRTDRRMQRQTDRQTESIIRKRGSFALFRATHTSLSLSLLGFYWSISNTCCVELFISWYFIVTMTIGASLPQLNTTFCSGDFSSLSLSLCKFLHRLIFIFFFCSILFLLSVCVYRPKLLPYMAFWAKYIYIYIGYFDFPSDYIDVLSLCMRTLSLRNFTMLFVTNTKLENFWDIVTTNSKTLQILI